MAYNYLIDYALKNVWCTPEQDNQSIIRPKRLTKIGGVRNSVRVLWRQHALPVANTTFHVYQIGQVSPSFVGLYDVELQWKKMSEVCEQENIVVDIYAHTGIQMPRTAVWYMVTQDRNLIIAVKFQRTIPIDLDSQDIYVRLYSNAYYRSTEANDSTDFIEVRGGLLSSTDDIVALQNQYATAAARPIGKAVAYVNGVMVSAINLINCAVGDYAEYIYDASIYRTVTLTISDLKFFESELDSKMKYLIHYEGDSPRGIDFYDDIDFFLVKPISNVRFKGVLYHKNNEGSSDAVRMVTHKDYSIPTTYVEALANAQDNWGDVGALKIEMHIRKAGWHRGLQYEHHRIHELYKLTDEEVLDAMVGTNATVDVWTAASLEQSAYSSMMSIKPNLVTPELVQEAYGYNAISKILADTPQTTELASGFQQAKVPYGLMDNCTVYEYDINGKLLGWNYHAYGDVYQASNNNTRMVEMIAGIVGDRLGEEYGLSEQTLDSRYDYRMYTCSMVDGVPVNDWEDVTGSNQYIISGNTLTWLVDPTQRYTLVRSNERTLGYDVMLMPSKGNLIFSLTHKQVRNGIINDYTMQIPMGELDVFLNGNSLIEGVDYFVNFPQIAIVSKKYLVTPHLGTQQKVTVRFSGFCDAQFNRDPLEDVGFIRFGMLSHNNRFDLREDKVLRIVVGGALYHRNELLFSEDSTAVLVPDAKNGMPYCIRDIVVPMRGFTAMDTYDLRAESQAVDQLVGDYMTLKYEQQVVGTPNVISQLYELFSPFACAILYDLASGIINDPRIYQIYSTTDLREICQPYENLLAFDPTQETLRPDADYTIIHPHNLSTPFTLNLQKYKFFKKVIDHYMPGKLILNGFVQIG